MRAIPVCIGGNSSVSRKVLVIDAALQLPQAGILEKHAHGGEPAENDAVPPFKEPQLQDVGPEKCERRPHQQGAHPSPAPPLPPGPRAPSRLTAPPVPGP